MISISNPVIGRNEIKAVIKVLSGHTLSQGKEVYTFEQNFSTFCGGKYAIATNNGTSALHTALYAAKIHPGDEVITTPFTFVATVNSILMVRATPVFVDIDPKTYNIDSKKIENAITKKTKAIIAVNLYGQPCDFSEINAIAKKHKLIIIEDAAQSVNALYKKRKSGNLTDISCFSFYATKNITCGEGGIVTTNNKNYFKRAKQFINQGQKMGRSYEYSDIGYNYRMTNISAAMLIEQLKRVDWITQKRQSNASLYNQSFKNLNGLITPSQPPDRSHVYHQYTIRITKDFPLTRNKLITYLEKKGIQARIYYPKLLYYYPHIKKVSVWQKCYNAELAAKEVLSLPTHPSLTETDIRNIVKTILSV